jgi:hypothetical protein
MPAGESGTHCHQLLNARHSAHVHTQKKEKGIEITDTHFEVQRHQNEVTCQSTF